MPIYRLLGNTIFDQELIDLMVSVFETVSQEIGLAQKQDAIREFVAKAIIDCAERGIRDPVEMRNCAHEVLQRA